MNVVIVKYNAGNIQSVLYALERIGVEAKVTDDHAEIQSADKGPDRVVGGRGRRRLLPFDSLSMARNRGLAHDKRVGRRGSQQDGQSQKSVFHGAQYKRERGECEKPRSQTAFGHGETLRCGRS